MAKQTTVRLPETLAHYVQNRAQSEGVNFSKALSLCISESQMLARMEALNQNEVAV